MGCQGAAGPRTVFHDDRLAQRFPEFVGQGPRNCVE